MIVQLSICSHDLHSTEVREIWRYFDTLSLYVEYGMQKNLISVLVNCGLVNTILVDSNTYLSRIACFRSKSRILVILFLSKTVIFFSGY